jgi:Flp pilus assembly protein TadG
MFHRISTRKSSQARRRGAALVEMALVSPLLIAMLLGIIEFGRALSVGQFAAAAVRDAARYATNDDVTNADVIGVVRSHVSASTGINPGDVLVTITVTKRDGTTSSSLSGVTTNDLVTVRVEIPFNSVGYISGNAMKDQNIVSQCAMWHR